MAWKPMQMQSKTQNTTSEWPLCKVSCRECKLCQFNTTLVKITQVFYSNLIPFAGQ